MDCRAANVEDRRGDDIAPGGSFHLPGGRGGFGIGTIPVLGLIGYWLGIEPRLLICGAEILSSGDSSRQQSYPGESGSRRLGKIESCDTFNAIGL